MAPTIATPRKRGRPAKSVAANGSVASTPTNAPPQTPNSSLKRKQPEGIFGYSPERTHVRTTTFYKRIELLNDLSYFCGVGSLEILMPRRAGSGGEAPDGWLWLETPGPAYKHSKFSIEASLSGLTDCGVVRCTYCMVNGRARVRVYVLPDDVGRSMISRSHENLRKWLSVVMSAVDVSRDSWKGERWRCNEPVGGFRSKQSNDESSLSKIFNKLESPKPDPELFRIKDENTRELLRDVLNEGNKIPGMKTKLYNYQKRSVAMMLQKELAPDKIEDPRLRLVAGPRGEKYYLDFETMEIFESPRYYEDVKGGILAEEMGTGKTLICLAVILASKHQISYIPDEYVSAPPLRPSVASLSDMCVSVIWRNALPWTQFLDSMPENCTKMIKNNHGFYEVLPTRRSRSSRYAYDSDAMEKIYLGTGTIIVCPQNLVSQWEDEIEKHIEKDTLKVLKIIKGEKIPSVLELLSHDVVIISRPCFDKEAREGRDNHGRTEAYGVRPRCNCMYVGATRTPDCVCFTKEGVYKSPLMSIQWKRLIVDEGHSMASSPGGHKSNGVCVAEKLPVERRWIVTGTPTSLLVGVMPEMEDETEGEREERVERELEEQDERQGDEAQHLDRVGRMVCDFLKQKPWAPMDDRRNTEKASWKRYVSKAFMEKRIGSTERVRSIFQRLFVRHRIDVIDEQDPRPPLNTKVVKLMPGFFEKVSMNLIVGAIKSNEVTSERTGPDYLFNPANSGVLRKLKNNLLGWSGFYPGGYSVEEVKGTVDTSRKYLEENGTRCGEDDIQLLLETIKAGEMALKTRMWRDMSTFQVMVYFLSDFPEQLAPAWSFSTCDGSSPGTDTGKLLEIDGPKLQDLQKAINAHGHEYNFLYKLESIGKDLDATRQKNLLRGSPQKSVGRPSANVRPLATNRTISKESKKAEKTSKTPLKPALKASKPGPVLPSDSPLAKAKIVGTPSTKLTYLMGEILALHKTEKILVFYESEHVSGYILQALEIIGVEGLSYSGNITLKQRTEHLEHFQHDERFRVLLMNLKYAAYGLNIFCATRLFFVSPVWQRDIERQAIKRAHRIGQKKEVYVETLILVGTAEEEMWKRSREMTQREQNGAKDSLKDSKMRDIILNLQFLTVEPGEGEGKQKAKMLKTPEPIFGDGKHGGVYDDLRSTRPSAITSAVTLSRELLEKTVSPTVSTQVSGSDERVASDLMVPDAQVAIDLDTRVRWVDASPQASSASSRKRKLSDISAAASSEESAGSSSWPVKRGKKVGFKANDSKDWMEDSDDDFEAPTAGKGKGKGRGKVVNFTR